MPPFGAGAPGGFPMPPGGGFPGMPSPPGGFRSPAVDVPSTPVNQDGSVKGDRFKMNSEGSAKAAGSSATKQDLDVVVSEHPRCGVASLTLFAGSGWA